MGYAPCDFGDPRQAFLDGVYPMARTSIDDGQAASHGLGPTGNEP